MRNDGRDRLAIRGVVGTLALVLAVLAGLNLNKLPLIGNNDVMHVHFAEAGGLKNGDDVLISGAQVGKVRSVRLDGEHVVADIVLTDADVKVGEGTEARIVTVTLLGRAAVELEPRGPGDLSSGGTIPVDRTSSPYNLTSTLNQLTETTAAIDKAKLADALGETSAMLQATGSDIGPALEGVMALSSAVAANDDALTSLVDRADRVTGVLATRDEQLASLFGAGRSLLEEVDARQDVVVSLLRSARRLSSQLRLTMRDTDDVLGPALKELDKVVDVLNKNKDNLQATITGLRGYTTGVGESLASGPWFDIYIQNLTSPATLAPILSGLSQ
ncbi:MCE family protein [Nocardioides sp. CPCC 206347]|uniref:MCE family protein n=1 Tax=Nocardioides sp. CPCC 206347 TaxID=3406463 RepID=UPI003B428EFE